MKRAASEKQEMLEKLQNKKPSETQVINNNDFITVLVTRHCVVNFCIFSLFLVYCIDFIPTAFVQNFAN